MKRDISQLRSLPIEGVAERLGLSVRRHRSLCPFHDDSHPSMTYYVGRNTYKCFVCDAYGGVIDLAMKVLGIGIVGTSDKIDLTHTGFVIYYPGQKPVLRHASSQKKQVVEVPLDEYLQTRKVPGVTFFKFIQH